MACRPRTWLRALSPTLAHLMAARVFFSATATSGLLRGVFSPVPLLRSRRHRLNVKRQACVIGGGHSD